MKEPAVIKPAAPASSPRVVEPAKTPVRTPGSIRPTPSSGTPTKVAPRDTTPVPTTKPVTTKPFKTNPVTVKPTTPGRTLPVKPDADRGSNPSTTPATPSSPNTRTISPSVKPLPTDGFRSTGPAPRTNDVAPTGRSDRSNGRGNVGVSPGGRDLPAQNNVQPSPVATTKLVSDRATRFSGITTAVPFDHSGGRKNSYGGGNSGSYGNTYDSNDYWDGYYDGHRDGYRRGYRNGYGDGRWDDCWSSRHRWSGWGWGGGWGSSCWSGWSFTIGWSAPVVYYSSPVYYYTPVYRSSVIYSSTSWYGSSSVTTTTYYDPSPRCDIVDFCDVVAAPSTTIVYAATPSERVVEVNLPSYQPTVYRSDELAGVLGWNDTPDAVVGALLSVSPADRAGASANYLGRVPAGGWDVGFEADKVVDGERQLWFRSLTPGPRGQRVLVVMSPKTSVPTMYAGQRVQITGRLAEICVDDPFEQGGRVTLGDGSVKY